MKNCVVIVLAGFMFAAVLCAPSPSFSFEDHIPPANRDIRSVMGFLDFVGVDVIGIKGELYRIEDVPVVDKSGEEIDLELLIKGAKVEIYVKRGEAIKVIYIHGYILQ